MVTSVEVAPHEVELEVADTLRLAAVARSATGKPLTDLRFSWVSVHPTVAGVDSAGLVLGRLAGRATIRVSASGKTATAVVTVVDPPSSPPPPTPPSITELEPSSIQAGWANFTLIVRGSGFRPSSRVLWNELLLETVVVDSTRIQAQVPASLVESPDTVSVSVKDAEPGSGASNTLTFVVHPRPVHSVRLLLPANTVFLNNRTQLQAEALDQFGVVLAGRTIQWSARDSTVVRIENGHILGLKEGATDLTATAGQASATMIFYVAHPPADGVLFEEERGGQPELFLRSFTPGASITRLQPPGTYGGQAEPDALGQRIAFVKRTDGSNLDIWVSHRDGSNLRRLTTHPAIDDQPTWSPDGRMIAYRSWRSGKSDIWVVPVDGGPERNLTASEGWVPEEINDRPTWSPRGDLIAFSRGFGIGQSLYTVRPDGSDLREIKGRPNFDLLEPAYSPDGAVLAFRSRDRRTTVDQIEFVSLQDGEAIQYAGQVPASARTPAWLDGGWLAVSAPVLPGSSSPTVVLVHLLSRRTVVPLDGSGGAAREPAGLRK